MWTDELKACDAVILDPGMGFDLAMYPVDRVTPTQIIIGTWRFRRKDGFRVGSTKSRILQPNPALLERIQRNRLVKYIVSNGAQLRLATIPIKDLEAIVDRMKMVPKCQ